jgi:plastocyanin
VNRFAWNWGCRVGLAVAVFAVTAIAGPAGASEEMPEIRLAEGRFQPSELVVQAGAPFTIQVTNASEAAIEFESFELHRERVVKPGETIVVRFPSISAGSYRFFDDFHSEVPSGAIVAK